MKTSAAVANAGKALQQMGFRIRLYRIRKQRREEEYNERQIAEIDLLAEYNSKKIPLRTKDFIIQINGKTKQGASTIDADIRKLENNNMIITSLDPTDKRVHFISLSENGIEVAKKLLQDRLEMYKTINAAFESCPKEKLDAFTEVSGLVNAALENLLALPKNPIEIKTTDDE